MDSLNDNLCLEQLVAPSSHHHHPHHMTVDTYGVRAHHVAGNSSHVTGSALGISPASSLTSSHHVLTSQHGGGSGGVAMTQSYVVKEEKTEDPDTSTEQKGKQTLHFLNLFVGLFIFIKWWV